MEAARKPTFEGGGIGDRQLSLKVLQNIPFYKRWLIWTGMSGWFRAESLADLTGIRTLDDPVLNQPVAG